MNQNPLHFPVTSRRQFIKNSGTALLGGALGASIAFPQFSKAQASAGEKRNLREPVDYANPMIGSGHNSRWIQFPGATMPFGLVKLSPDNQEETYFGGYEYDIPNIMGFSHIHSYAMSGLLMMPTTGPLQVNPGPQTDPDKGYRSRFRHETEVASPGYYAVTLDDYKIRAEMTTTIRTGFSRYTFPQSDESYILFDLMIPSEHGCFIYDSLIRKVSNTEIEGFIQVQTRMYWLRAEKYTLHFVARFSKPFEYFGGWASEVIFRTAKDRIPYNRNGKVPDEISGKWNPDIGGFVKYTTAANEVVMVKTGISLVSIEQARLNLDTESGPFGWDFDAARQKAHNVWNDLLGTIRVKGGTEDDKVKFYTNLYRAYCGRAICSDCNGKYMDMDEQVQQLKDPNSPIYGSDALWMTFWNLNQLWSLANPDLMNQWIRSLLEFYDRGGWLPKTPEGVTYLDIMSGSPQVAMVVAAYQQGIRNYDVSKAYEACRRIMLEPGHPYRSGGYVGNHYLEDYMKLGYVPLEVEPLKDGAGDQGPSDTMEFAYEDWCVAQMAKALGKRHDHDLFLKRAHNYRNLFDRSTGFVRPRHRDGSWVEKTDATTRKGFTESSAWVYTLFVPHDVAGLIELIGGREKFNARLVEGFEKSRSSRFASNRYVDLTNQPNMQAPYLFNYSGAPWLTQKYVREIMEKSFGTEPNFGWVGDEDQGQMGGWFVMSALGLFQMAGGAGVEPIFEIGSPLFEKITVRLDPRYFSGKEFVVEARNNSKENVYIQSATFNRKPLEKPWIKQSEVVAGGLLVLEMGPEPNKQWGSAPDAAPPSMSDPRPDR